MRPKEFVKRANNLLSECKVTGDVSGGKLSRSGVRAELLQRYRQDEAMRRSVREVIEAKPNEGLFGDRRGAEKEQLCAADGRCDIGDLPQPGGRLYTARSAGSFQRNPVSGEVTYVDARGVQMPVRAVACGAGASHPYCSEDRDDASTVVDLVGRRGRHRVDLSPDGTPSVAGYRVRFGNDVYAIENRVQVDASRPRAEADCAMLLCMANEAACPAPYCTRRGGACAPNDGMVSGVQLKPMAWDAA